MRYVRAIVEHGPGLKFAFICRVDSAAKGAALAVLIEMGVGGSYGQKATALFDGKATGRYVQEARFGEARDSV